MKSLPLSLVRGAAIAAAALSLVLAGCGESSNVVSVKGTVTVDGQPVPNGTISFVAKDGVAATGGGVIKDGAYVAQTSPGDKWVMVLGTKVVGQEPVYAGVADSPMREKIETVTAPAYNAAHQTPLEANVDAEKEGLNFELTKSVKPRA